MRSANPFPIFCISVAVFLISLSANADTYTQATFTGAINGGNANVKAPFNTNGFTQSDPFSGSFVFDNQLVPGPGTGFTNVFFSNFPDIAAIPNPVAFSFTLDSLSFNLGDNINALRLAGIQYNNGVFNGFVFIADFPFLGNEYQLRTEGPVISVQ